MTFDEKIMSLCLELAKKGKNKTFPNPMVGCVIVSEKKENSSWRGSLEVTFSLRSKLQRPCIVSPVREHVQNILYCQQTYGQIGDTPSFDGKAF